MVIKAWQALFVLFFRFHHTKRSKQEQIGFVSDDEVDEEDGDDSDYVEDESEIFPGDLCVSLF